MSSKGESSTSLHFVRIDPAPTTCARLVAYRGFSGDDDFAAQAIQSSVWDSGKTTTKAVPQPQVEVDRLDSVA